MPRPKKTTRATRTKADVEDEFDDIRNSVSEDRDPIATALAKQEKANAKAAAGGLTVDTVVNHTATLGLALQKSLSNITEQLTSKVQELENIQLAIQAETAELENLHKIDIAKTSVDMLVQEYNALVDVHETEMAVRRNNWDEEQQDWTKKQKELELFTKQRRERDEAEYQYNQNQIRRINDDENKRRQMDLESNWKKREEALVASEQELSSLRNATALFPQTVKTEVDQAVASATTTLAKDHAHNITIMRKDYESQIALLRQEIGSGNTVRAALTNAVERLQAQVEAANQKVADIAAKSVDAASGQQALARVTEIVNNNNGTTTRGKA